MTAPAADGRVYYRGIVPGDTRRISTGNAWWDGHLFVATRREQALCYGPEIETVVFRTDARILRAGTRQFAAVERAAGVYHKTMGALDKATSVARQAERDGYAAVDFVLDFAGTIVLDESAVTRGV